MDTQNGRTMVAPVYTKVTSFEYGSLQAAVDALHISATMSGYVFGYTDRERHCNITFHKWGVEDLPFKREEVVGIDLAEYSYHMGTLPVTTDSL